MIDGVTYIAKLHMFIVSNQNSFVKTQKAYNKEQHNFLMSRIVLCTAQ